MLDPDGDICGDAVSRDVAAKPRLKRGTSCGPLLPRHPAFRRTMAIIADSGDVIADAVGEEPASVAE